jgi:glycosyltransferase involved in cell wall biosynthesis
VEVREEHVPVWEGRRHAWNAGPAVALRLAAAEARLLVRRADDADALIVGYPGHFDLPAARRAAAGKPVVFNPLVSLADTFVSDRRRFRAGSLAARALERVDRAAFGAADVVVADTQTDARFFGQLTDTPIEVCLVGAEDRLFTPGWKPVEPFTVLFVGKLIPLHGVETILAAARRLPNIRFRVVGSGQLGTLLEARPPNVEHVPWVDYDTLPSELHRAGCALGIFGTSDKALRVIPNKAFQALACGTPFVTGDTPAARELLADEESALLVEPGNPTALAQAVQRLAEHVGLAQKIGAGGRATYEQQASEAVLGPRWRAILEGLA